MSDCNPIASNRDGIIHFIRWTSSKHLIDPAKPPKYCIVLVFRNVAATQK